MTWWLTVGYETPDDSYIKIKVRGRRVIVVANIAAHEAISGQGQIIRHRFRAHQKAKRVIENLESVLKKEDA